MKPIKNATVPRRKALWVQRKHHTIIKHLGTMLEIAPHGLIVEDAIDEYLERRPNAKAKIEMLMGEGEAGKVEEV